MADPLTTAALRPSALDGPEARPTTVEPEVSLHRVPGRPRESFLLVRGEATAPRGPLVVAVHGISREPERYAEAFGRGVVAVGGALVVPHFPEKGYRGYQRIRCNAGRRADRTLLRMLEHADELLGRPEGRFLLFGFSGGAKFAHRFALLHAERVERMVLASAGNYTFPDPTVRYPLGLRRSRRHRRLDLDLEAALRIPTLVLAGDRDIGRDPALLQGEIDRLQGRDRVARARRYTVAVNLAARAQGLTPPARFALLPDADHGFESCLRAGGLVARTLDFLLGDAADPTEPGP